jgi:hypothetical protein
MIRASSIIAIKGKDFIVRNFAHAPTLTKEMLLARDRYVCAYCANRFRVDQLDMEHIVPRSKGGEDSWMNLVAACKACNSRKANRTPEAAGMKLHYVPYVPNRYEAFILSNRKILADQGEFLRQGVPKTSRVHAQSSYASSQAADSWTFPVASTRRLSLTRKCDPIRMITALANV